VSDRAGGGEKIGTMSDRFPLAHASPSFFGGCTSAGRLVRVSYHFGDGWSVGSPIGPGTGRRRARRRPLSA